MEIMNLPYRPYVPDRRLPGLNTTAAPSRAPAAVDRSGKLYKVAVEFEAIFIKQMLNVMRQSVAKTGLLHGGMAEEFFEDMLYDEYAQKMAESGNFGIAEMICRQLGPQES